MKFTLTGSLGNIGQFDRFLHSLSSALFKWFSDWAGLSDSISSPY
jgi:hypothetical protein